MQHLLYCLPYEGPKSAPSLVTRSTLERERSMFASTTGEQSHSCVLNMENRNADENGTCFFFLEYVFSRLFAFFLEDAARYLHEIIKND